MNPTTSYIGWFDTEKGIFPMGGKNWASKNEQYFNINNFAASLRIQSHYKH